MRLEDERESDYVEDRRGGGLGVPVSGGSLGVGGVILALMVSYFTGINPMTLMGLVQDQAPQVRSAPAHKPPANDDMARFVSKVLASTEDTWSAVFQEKGQRYTPPHLVLFTGSTPTACGIGREAMGPFYCPADRRVYIDLAFYRQLKERFHAPGEFAEAYVIAHEIGHHVQNLMGISEKVHQRQQAAGDPALANALSVRLELQADCLAGVWAKRADSLRHILEPGEMEQAITAASAIGDDTLQAQAGRAIRPDTFTHGSSAQRIEWFRRGIESGNPGQCNTFARGAV
jgi:predicted metalloprotease